MGVALFYEVIEDEVGGESFCDATEVELEVVSEDGDGFLGFVEAEVVDAAAAFGGGDLGFVRDDAVAFCFAPEVGEGAVGGVEEAVGLLGEFLTEEEAAEEVFADLNGGVEGGFGEAVELRVGFVVGGLIGEFFGEVECVLHGEVACFGVGGVGGDLEEGAHEGALGFDADGGAFFLGAGWGFVLLTGWEE